VGAQAAESIPLVHGAGDDALRRRVQGRTRFDTVSAIEQWVEKSKAPEQMIASHSADGKVDRTRPVCAYPQVAKYKGTGSIDDAANFACKAR